MNLNCLLTMVLVAAACAAACNGQIDIANLTAGDAGGDEPAPSEGGPDAASGSESDALTQPDVSGHDSATEAYDGGSPVDAADALLEPEGSSQDADAEAYDGGSPVDAADLGDVSSDSGTAPICAGSPATCSTPPGVIEPFSSIDRVYGWVAGKWLFCTGQATWQSAPSDAIGVEFTPGSSAPTAGGSTAGGSLFYLVQGPSGPVRGAGFNYQLAYDVSPEGTGYQLNVHPAPNSGFWLSLKYSACPRELDVIYFYSTTDSVLIPAD